MDMDAKNLVPSEGQALVYIVRLEAFFGSAIAMDVFCNKKYFGSTGGRRFVYIILDPGKYQFSGRAENMALLNLSVEAGLTYYVIQQVLPGIMTARNSLELLTEEDGRMLLEKCFLSKAFVPDAMTKGEEEAVIEEAVIEEEQ